MKQLAVSRLLAIPLALLLMVALPICASAEDIRTGEQPESRTEQTGLPGNRVSGPDANEKTESDGGQGTTVTKQEEKPFPVLPVLVVVAVAAGCVAAVAIRKKPKPVPNDGKPYVDIQTEPVRREPPQPKNADIPTIPRPPKHYYLCIEGGPMDGREYPLSDSPILIGRDSACRIRYPKDTPGVSGQHCKVLLQNGSPMLVDLKSRCGTSIQGTPITAAKPTALQDGDVIWLGGKENTIVLRSK